MGRLQAGLDLTNSSIGRKGAVTRMCEERVREGLMLQEDADRFIAAARQKNPLDASVRLGPLIQAGAYTCR